MANAMEATDMPRLVTNRLLYAQYYIVIRRARTSESQWEIHGIEPFL